MTSYMEAAREAAEYDECEHGVPTCYDCLDCMKRAHADEIRALNEEVDAERAAVVKFLRALPDSHKVGGQIVGTGYSPSVVRALQDAADAIERGEHIGRLDTST